MSLLHGLLDDILGDSPTSIGENSPQFAPDSPLENMAQTRVVSGFSPNSPNSPRSYDSPNGRTGGENRANSITGQENSNLDFPKTPPAPPPLAQQQTGELWVIAFTPSGRPITVKAESPQHAEWIQRMNPPPKEANP